MGNDFILMIHCLAYLAVHHHERFSSQQLAHNACTNPVVVRRLMSLAVSQGYVNVQQGPTGGYQIQVDPAKIKLGDLFTLVGEDVRLTKQMKESVDEVCMVANNMGPVLEELQQAQIAAQIAFYNERTLTTIVQSLTKRQQEKERV